MYGHESCHFLCTLCTTKKKASSILYVWSQKLPLFVYAMYHKKEGKIYTILWSRKLPLFVYAMYHKKVSKFYTILMLT